MFSRDAVLLIGHGSDSLPDAARPLFAHADVIRGMARFAEVGAGVLRGEPNAGQIFDGLTAAVVHVVPFFLEDGFFTRMAIPDLLLPRVPSSRVVRFCPPVGTYDGISAAMSRRVLNYCELFGIAPNTLTVILAGHGSARDPGRARALKRHTEMLENSGRFGRVKAAFLEEPPRLAAALAASRGHHVAVLGYLANEGTHAIQDLPRIIGEERQARGTLWPPVHDMGTIAADEFWPGLIVDRIVASR